MGHAMSASPGTASLKAILVLFVVLLVMVYLGTRLYWTWHRLRHIPGPPGTGLSKWWMLRNTLGGDMHLATKDACKKYGE